MRKDRKMWMYVVGSCAAACVFAACIIYAVYIWTRPAVQQEVPLEPQTAVESQTENVALYRVTTYRGHIGVYDASGILQSEVMVSMDRLPEKDQKKLQDGIEVYSEKELSALMEDLTG